MSESICIQCSTKYLPKPGTFGKFCSLSCSCKYNGAIKKAKKLSHYSLNPKRCQHCDQILDHSKRNNKFCSRSCSAKSTNQIPRKRGPTPRPKVLSSAVKFIWCDKANQWYSNHNPDGSIRRTSPYIKDEKQRYYAAARFRFNVYNYPKEFDLDLIQRAGWYTCPGRKRKRFAKNIDGVSRDHIISVSYGYNNGIDPKIIAHPANCRIVLQSQNKQKAESCLMTLDQLLTKISEWDAKYRTSGAE